MSYLFVYQADKHKSLTGEKRYYGYEQMHTHYGVFDKASMWRAFRYEYTLHGYGENEMQKLLKRYGLVDRTKGFTGHLIELPTAKLAIWLKLNYDNISKVERCEYVGCYKDVDASKVEKYTKKIDALKTEARELNEKMNWCYSASRQVGGFESNMEDKGFPESDITKISGFYDIVKGIEEKWHKKLTAVHKRIKYQEDKIVDYLDSCKVS